MIYQTGILFEGSLFHVNISPNEHRELHYRQDQKAEQFKDEFPVFSDVELTVK